MQRSQLECIVLIYSHQQVYQAHIPTFAGYRGPGRGNFLKDGKFPLLLGGEHLVTLGAVRAAVKKYPDLHIVHFDAHADLRDDYLGAKLSHACVLRRCHELVGDGHIHQFCIRSGDRAEFEFAAQHTEMHKFDFTGLAELTAQLCESKVPVYLTIDLDCLDPSCFPGTGTPEAGGVSFCSCWMPSAL